MIFILISMKRRRRQMTSLVLVTLIASFFMAGIMLFQTVINGYVRERNMSVYGDWVLAAGTEDISHPYLTDRGHLLTSTLLCDDTGEVNGMRIGTIGEDMMNFSRISLYEGRLPEKDDEIAVDLYALAREGYTNDLGQEITVTWNEAGKREEPVLHEKTYRLVGIVRSFSLFWCLTDTKKADFFVTEEELSSSYPQADSTWFYRLDPALGDINTEEFAGVVKSGLENGTFSSYNRYSYEGSIWDNRELYTRVVLLQAAITVFALTWLLAGYVNGRRAAWYRMRCMGISRFRLNGIILSEMALTTVPAAMVGLGLAWLAGYIVCSAVAASGRLHGFFAFDLKTFGWQVLAVFGTVAVCILASVLSTGDKRLSAGTKSVSKRGLRRLHRMRRGRHPERELFARGRKLSPFTTLSGFLFSMAAAAFCVLCIPRIGAAVNWIRYTAGEPDYQISAGITVNREYGSQGGVSMGEGLSFTWGITEEELQELKAIDGVRSVEAVSRDRDYHFLSWEGIGESPIVQLNAQKINGVPDLLSDYKCAVTCLSDENALQKIAARKGHRLTEAELEAWQKGELAVLILHPWDMGSIASVEDGPDRMNDESITSGDLLTIIDPVTEESLQVTAVVTFENEMMPWGQEYDVSIPLSLLVSETLRDRLITLAGDGSQLRYNDIGIRFNSFASYEGTDKLLARFAGERGYSYSNMAEERRVGLNEYGLHPLLIYGCLLSVTVFIFLVIRRSLTRTRMQDILPTLQRARRLGMDKKTLMRGLMKAQLKENHGILIGFVPGTLLLFYRSWLSLKSPTMYMRSHFLGMAMTNNRLLKALEETLFSGNYLLPAAAVFILYLITAAFCFRISTEILKKEGIQ